MLWSVLRDLSSRPLHQVIYHSRSISTSQAPISIHVASHLISSIHAIVHARKEKKGVKKHPLSIVTLGILTQPTPQHHMICFVIFLLFWERKQSTKKRGRNRSELNEKQSVIARRPRDESNIRRNVIKQSRLTFHRE